MNHEDIKRLKKASEYQMLAVKALLPERAAEHMEVIGKEIKNMMKECIVDLFSQEKKDSHTEENNHDNQSKKNLKKIDIS